MKKILIIGAEFVGSNLAYSLNQNNNNEIYLLDIINRKKLKNLKLNKLKNCKYLQANYLIIKT